MHRPLLLLPLLLWSGCDVESGGLCTDEERCVAGLLCFESRCRSQTYIGSEIKRRAALQAQAEVQEASERRRTEARLLRQSGVASPPQAEAAPDAAVAGSPPHAPGPGQIRVARTRGKGRIFAACRPDERLLSGGCNAWLGSGAISESYPELAPGTTDTLGARWICAVKSRLSKPEVEAHALCQALSRPGDQK